MLLNLLVSLSAVVSFSGTIENSFSEYASHTPQNEQKLLREYNIENWDDLESFYKSAYSNSSTNNNKAISNVLFELESKYPEYLWVKDNFNTTINVSGCRPVNVQDEEISKYEIEDAIEQSNIESDYGGCGPIAMIGILDYFSRYLGYYEINSLPDDQLSRIELEKKVFKKVKTYEQSGVTITYPKDYKNAFNSLIKDFEIDTGLRADFYNSIMGGSKEDLWNLIVEQVNKGLPVTMFSGIKNKDNPFANHYSNIYGYERWIGIHNESNEMIEKRYIKGLLNGDNWPGEWYCDIEFLDNPLTGIIYYDLPVNDSYMLTAENVSTKFINDEGQGQYFFMSKSIDVRGSNNKLILTKRLRCSYIENKYLVLSPNRQNAGEAYLEMPLYNDSFFLTFDAGLWSKNEGIFKETFYIEYYFNGGWKKGPEYDLGSFSMSKDNLQTYSVLFPKGAEHMRFVAKHSEPSGDRNKGRVVLDNITFNFNNKEKIL